jgi:hypothetical protein
MKRHLAAHGLPDDLVTLREASGVVISSTHRSVWDAELGVAGIAPRGVLETAARAALPAVLRTMVAALNEDLR